MASPYLGVHDQSEGLASSGDIPTGMISGTAFFSQHLLWLASDIIPQVQTLEYESQGHGCFSTGGQHSGTVPCHLMLPH